MYDLIHRQTSRIGRDAPMLPISFENRSRCVPTGVSNVGPLKSRVEATMGKETNVLPTSTWMSVLDRIIDWFQGSPRRSALEALFQQVCGPEADTRPQTQHQRVRAFYELKRMAKPLYQDRFVMTMERSSADANSLQFKLKVDDVELHSATAGNAPLQACMDFNRIASAAGFTHAHDMKLQGEVLVEGIERAVRSMRHDLDDAVVEQCIDHLKQCVGKVDAVRPYEEPIQALSRQLSVASANLGNLPMAIEIDTFGKGEVVNLQVRLRMHASTTADVVAKEAGRSATLLYDGDLKAQDSENLSTLILRGLVMRMESELAAQIARWEDPSDLVEMNLQTVTDCMVTRDWLRENMDDKRFNDQTVRTVKTSQDGSTMSATFFSPKGDRTFDLSARSSTNGEFRGEPLQKALAGKFDSFRHLLAENFLTKNDPRIRLSMSRLFADVKAMKDTLSLEHRRQIVDTLAPLTLVAGDTNQSTPSVTIGDVLKSEFTAFLDDRLDERDPIRRAA